MVFLDHFTEVRPFQATKKGFLGPFLAEKSRQKVPCPVKMRP